MKKHETFGVMEDNKIIYTCNICGYQLIDDFDTEEITEIGGDSYVGHFGTYIDIGFIDSLNEIEEMKKEMGIGSCRV